MKIIAFIAAILSAATVATLAFTTVPTVQKQSDDNAAAIETLGGAVSDNAAAIETLSYIKIYDHYITIESSNILICLKITSQTASYSVDSLIEYLDNNQLSTENDVISATGRYYWGQGNVIIYGLYAYSNNLYAVALSSGTTTPTVTSYLVENPTLSDNSILIN